MCLAPRAQQGVGATIATMTLAAALLTRIDHVGIAVPDLDAAIEFYGRAFGLSVVHEEVNEKQGVREAMLGVGESCIQLLAPLTPESTIAKFLDRSGPGIQQIAYGVDDVEAAAAALRAAGVRMLYDQAQVGTAGSLVNFCHPKDCGGVLVELVQSAGTAAH
jgi:methylmalonyl-CoA/ethylmalonyl-CoA epimerase